MKPKTPAAPEPVEDPCAMDAVTITVGTPRTLILLLGSNESSVTAHACEALCAYVESGGDPCKIELCKVGVLEPLIGLLGGADLATKTNACQCIASLAEEQGARVQIRKAGGIKTLIDLLAKETDTLLMETVSMCIEAMAGDFLAKSVIRKLGGLPIIVQLLSHSEPEIQKHGIGTLLLMVEEYQTRVDIRTTNAIVHVVAILKSEYDEIRNLALGCLARCAQDAEVRTQIREAGGLATLIEYLDPDDADDMNVKLLVALSNCIEDKENVSELQRLGGLNKLFEIMGASTGDVQTEAVTAVARACRTAFNRQILVDHGVVEALVGLLKVAETNERTLEACGLALAYIAESASGAAVVAQEGGIPLIMQHMGGESREQKENMMLTLANCSANPATRVDMQEHKCLKTVFDTLHAKEKNGEINCKVYASACMANFAKEPAMRDQIVEQSGIKALVRCLKIDDVRLQANAASTLADLCLDRAGREKFVQCEGLDIIMELVQRPAKELQKGAIHVLAACASDSELEKKIIDANGFEILRSIAGSRGSTNEELAWTTLLRLLDNNLAAKFWLSGELPASCAVGDGFYDMGMSKEGSPFATLDALKAEPVNQKRAVLVWDVANDRTLTDVCKEAQERLKQCETLEQKVAAVARLVGERLGGPVPENKIATFSFELSLTQTKNKMKSNVLPIGEITHGTFYHRAFFFKGLCDFLGIPVSLHRGEYNRSWNTVLVKDGGDVTEFVVDTMHNMGQLIPAHSVLAYGYTKR